MRYPEAYVDYLVQFHAARDYFECHELLEEHWKRHPGDPLARAWVGLIQIAVALYHERRGNRAGARKMLAMALERNLRPEYLAQLGLDAAAALAALRERLEQLVNDGPPPAYVDLNLPIRDPELLERCLRRCGELGLTWLAPSDLEADELVHKHARRDRSDVIEARAAEWRRREERRRERPTR